MIDTHCHILNGYYDNIDEIIDNMNGNKMIVSSTGDDDIDEVISLAERFDNIFITLGVHPTDVEKIDDSFFNKLEANLNNNKVVAIGEIGLDYYWDTDKNLQKKYFIRQLDIARAYNLPVVIHCRDAIGDTCEIIDNYKDLKISFHCYSGSIESAKTLLKQDIMFGIGGTVTFKNNIKTKEVVEFLPLENILLETDSPFLTPVPFRGQKNEPKNILYVAKEIAAIKGVSLEEVLEVTTKNAISQFDLK